MALVAASTMLWTSAETQIAVLLAALMRADTDAAIAVYRSIRRSTARFEAIRQAAAYALDAESRQMIEALLMHLTTVENARNDLVHGFWGFADDVEDGLAWIDGKHVTDFHVLYNKLKLGKSVVIDKDSLMDKAFIYRKSDLESVLDQIKLAITIVVHYADAIFSLRGQVPFRLTGPSFNKLRSFASIQDALSEIRARI